MATLVSHAMRRYPPTPPGNSYCPTYTRGQDSWSSEESNESSLARSMRYAEPWLYGSVRAPQGLILTPALVLCSCSEYISGTKRSSKKSPSVCKKCKGTRLPLPAADTLRGAPKFGTVRCYPITPPSSSMATPMRSGTVRTNSKIRPSILPQGDPYEAMRRSRLTPESTTQFSTRVSDCRNATTKSATNGTIKGIPPANNSTLRVFSKNTPIGSNGTVRGLLALSSSINAAKSGTVSRAPKTTVLSDKFSSVGRRSILECNINPYDLMRSDGDSKDNGVTLLNGQRIRIRPSISEQQYEEIAPISSTKLKPPKIEKETECSPFKSILKKSSDQSSPDSSPSPKNKNGARFYLPTPRKKVQFLVEADLEVEEERKRDDDQLDEIAVYEDVEQCREDVQLEEEKPCPLRRSISERHIQEPPKVQFNDTMALRMKSSRGDSRAAFISLNDLERLDGVASRTRSESPKGRPLHPPPPPPAEPQNAIEKSSNVKSPIEKDDKMELPEQPPMAPPRKRSNNKAPAVSVQEPSTQPIIKINTPPPPTNDCPNKTVKITTPPPPDCPNKTVVQITATPAIHKIQIKNEFPDTTNIRNVSVSNGSQQKTSIMITGDDCYSTINVNEDYPMYQSSVVVKDSIMESPIQKPSGGSTVYITGNFNAPTKPTKSMAETKDLPVDRNDKLNRILNDPVEAVRLNLVPHVCGKSDMSRGHHEIEKFESSLLDEHLQSLTMANPTLTPLDNSLLKLKCYDVDDDKDLYSEHSSSTQYEVVEGSECYTDHSNRSSMAEEDIGNRTKFYELLADSAIAEISESEDHHYESIRINNTDPIYEEISPPPLPANPPPTNILDDLQLDKQFTTRSIFEGASKYDILSYLVDAKERGIVPEDCYNFGTSDVVIEEDSKDNLRFNRVSQMSSVSDSSEDSSLVISNGVDERSTKNAEIERNDSGVGSETSKSSLSRFRNKMEQASNCEDCDSAIETITENEPLICRKCVKKRSERKETIMEIVETEEKYNRDLQIVLEEFYQPMLVAGLLTPDQLSAIFLNVEELLENSQALAERLRDAVEIALEQGDEDLLTVNIGKLFLEAAPMLHAFETYCIRQGSASLLLANLEKDKELLRIFLRVSQMENTMLRRMNLNSFLMVPVQRVTKYPLLLTRLYKTTPSHHETREQLKEAQHKVELHLNHMNSETKDVPSKLWRRIGSSSGRRSSSEMDLVSIKLRKIAVDVLEWNHDEARFALEGKLFFTQPTDNNWRKGRTIKLAPVNALLVTHGKLNPGSRTERNEGESLTFPRNTGIREAALLLVRDKNGRYSLLREPLYLDRCIIATDPAWQSYFEVQEVIGKDTFIFKADDDDQTRTWYRQLQIHAQGLGAWRKRRNALANIMINGMGLRT